MSSLCEYVVFFITIYRIAQMGDISPHSHSTSCRLVKLNACRWILHISSPTNIRKTMIIEADNGTDKAEYRKLNAYNGEITYTRESKGRGLVEKRVSFSNDLTRIVEIANLEEYSRDEKSRAWYTADNVAEFKREARGKGSLIRLYYPTFVKDVEESYAVAEGFPRDEDELFSRLQQLNLLPHSVSWSGFFS